MGNQFNKLRLKIIRANNLLQFIHQVTIEFRLQKSMVQERFKSNFKFRNQIKGSSIKNRKGEILDKLKARDFNGTSLSTYDFSTRYTTLPHN